MVSTHHVERSVCRNLCECRDPNKHSDSHTNHELTNSPLFTLKVREQVDAERKKAAATGSEPESMFSQFALLGLHIGDDQTVGEREPVFMNVDAPNSTFICGSQGSGKSFTLSYMLKNCLLDHGNKASNVKQPVAGVLFHYDANSSVVAEASHLCSLGIDVNVLVSASNYAKLAHEYEKVAAKTNSKAHMKIQKLLLRSRDLNIERMRKFMAFESKEGAVPLYMEVIIKILREMAIARKVPDAPFDYNGFKRQIIAEEGLTDGQKSPMFLRLGLLESYLLQYHEMLQEDLKQDTARPKKGKGASAIPTTNTADANKSLFDLKPGSLTIIDLSDPFVEPSTACMLFDICLGLILENRPVQGLVIALDEAHKFMNDSTTALAFTERLLTTIRMQRHYGTRVIIATQEPTVSDKLLDLCSTTIVHRFTSPSWFESLRGHLGGASTLLTSTGERSGMFQRIMDLGVGESLVFSPASYLCMVNDDQEASETESEGEDGGKVFRKRGRAGKLGGGVVKMHTRNRGAGSDGGRSALASAT